MRTSHSSLASSRPFDQRLLFGVPTARECKTAVCAAGTAAIDIVVPQELAFLAVHRDVEKLDAP